MTDEHQNNHTLKQQTTFSVFLGAMLTLAALWAVPWSSSSAPLPDIFSYRANDLATLRQGFAQPPREAGPWVYWFWWNNVVSREEIARELEEMAAAGIAGAELRVVTFHGWGGPPLDGMDDANLERLGHRQLRYLSDEWLDMLAFTCATARAARAAPGHQPRPGLAAWRTVDHRPAPFQASRLEIPGSGRPHDLRAVQSPVRRHGVCLEAEQARRIENG